jgi:hypothetical protein
MNCGVGTPVTDSLSEWFSFIGLGGDQPHKEDSMDRTDRTPETAYFDHDDDDDDDDDDINETGAASRIISKQLSFIQCIPTISAAVSATTTTPKLFHRQCNPTTCRMTSGMCVDCAQCLNHCVCGDNANLLPATCDTPDCNPIICSDCMRCHTHCTCYCDPNLLRGDDNDTTNSRISFDPPSIDNKPPHQSSIRIKKVVLEKKDSSTNPRKTKTKANTKNKDKNNQHLDLSRRTHSLLSDHDDDENEENGKNDSINSRRFTDTSTNETQTKKKKDNDNNDTDSTNDRMANTRIVSIGGRNIVSDEKEEEEEDVFDDCEEIDEVYAEIEIPAEGTMSSIRATSPITTFDFSTTSTNNSLSPTRASASTSPRNNLVGRATSASTTAPTRNNNLGGRKRSWLPHLNRRRSITSSRK